MDSTNDCNGRTPPPTNVPSFAAPLPARDMFEETQIAYSERIFRPLEEELNRWNKQLAEKKEEKKEQSSSTPASNTN